MQVANAAEKREPRTVGTVFFFWFFLFLAARKGNNIIYSTSWLKSLTYLWQPDTKPGELVINAIL